MDINGTSSGQACLLQRSEGSQWPLLKKSFVTSETSLGRSVNLEPQAVSEF